MFTLTHSHNSLHPLNSPISSGPDWQKIYPKNFTSSPQLRQRKKVRKYHATRWNRLKKWTLPNALVVLLKHLILTIATFAGTLMLITLFLPSLLEFRFLIASAAILPTSLLPLILKIITRLLFNKSWLYRRCITPFVILACASSTLPGFILFKKGPSKAVTQYFQTENSASSSKSHPEPSSQRAILANLIQSPNKF